MYIYVYESILRHIEWLDNVSARVATPPLPTEGPDKTLRRRSGLGFRV